MSLAAELTESALFDVVSRPPNKTSSEPRRVAAVAVATEPQAFQTELPRSAFCSNAHMIITALSECEELQWRIASASDTLAALEALLSDARYAERVIAAIFLLLSLVASQE